MRFLGWDEVGREPFPQRQKKETQARLVEGRASWEAICHQKRVDQSGPFVGAGKG